MRRYRCRKCGQPPAAFIEVLECYTVFDVGPDGVPEDDGINKEGDILRVEARCANRHRWRLRGISNIDRLRERAAK